jgi:hypothetical protein
MTVVISIDGPFHNQKTGYFRISPGTSSLVESISPWSRTEHVLTCGPPGKLVQRDGPRGVVNRTIRPCDHDGADLASGVPCGAPADRGADRLHHSPARLDLAIPDHSTLSGYSKRARVEPAIGRYKQVIGDGLRSRASLHQATEVAIVGHCQLNPIRNGFAQFRFVSRRL